MIGIVGIMGFVFALVMGLVTIGCALGTGLYQNHVQNEQEKETRKLQAEQKVDAAASYKAENVAMRRQRQENLDAAARAIVLNEVHRNMAQKKMVATKRDIIIQRSVRNYGSPVSNVNRSNVHA